MPQAETLRPLRTAPSVWVVQLVGWTAYGIMVFVTFLPVVAAGECMDLAKLKLARAVTGFGLTCALVPFYRRLRREGVSAHTALWSVLACIVLGMLWTLIDDVVESTLDWEYDWAKARATFALSTLDSAYTLVGWSAVFFGINAWHGWQNERARVLKADALAQSARLESLRYQLHPHFLFNALNSVRALIAEDPRRAKNVVSEMADFYRYSLATADRSVVPLADELAAIESYLMIEQTRYEEKLQVRFDIEDAARHCLVPVLILHPLIENAVKHGFGSGAVPLVVVIEARLVGRSVAICVSNSVRERNAMTSIMHKPAGTGTGLRNVRERLQAMYHGAAHFELVVTAGLARAKVVIDDVQRFEGPAHARALG